MDVDTYVARHRPDWERLDRLSRGGSRTLMRMSGDQIEDVITLYLRVSGHLAEVRTRYHDPRLEEYLNQIVTRAHAAVYSGEPRSFRSLARVFGRRYRSAIRNTMPFIAVAAVILFGVGLATAIWVSGSREAEAGLVPSVVRGAIRRAGGGAFAGPPPAALSTQILVNNVQVALLAFALGALLCVPTMYIVAQNAVLIGALAGAYGAAGKAGVFWSLVLPHGFLELIAICIAAGAGMRIGWAFVSPGDRPRGVSVIEEARDALVVVIGVIPAFVAAAMIEGFLTPTAVPGPVKIGLGAAVAAAYVAFLAFPGFRAARAPSRAGSGRRALR